MLIFAGGYFL